MTKCADCDKGHLMSCGLCSEYNKEFPSGRGALSDSAQQERAAVVAWIKTKICQYMEEGRSIAPGSITRKLWDEHIVALSCVGASIEKGDHWPEGETP